MLTCGPAGLLTSLFYYIIFVSANLCAMMNIWGPEANLWDSNSLPLSHGSWGLGPGQQAAWQLRNIAIWPASLSQCKCSPKDTLQEMLYHIHLWTCKFHLSLETVFYISYILNSCLELAHPSLETEIKFRFILWCNIVVLWLSYLISFSPFYLPPFYLRVVFVRLFIVLVLSSD